MYLLLQCVTFIQAPNDRLLLQEVIAKLLTEPKRQHVMSECPENTHSTKLISVQMEVISNIRYILYSSFQEKYGAISAIRNAVCQYK